MWRWIELYRLPVVKRPDGIYMSTMTAIDEWIFLAADVQQDKMEASRNANVDAQRAIERLQRQIAADAENPGCVEGFLHARHKAALRAARGVGLAPGRKEPKRPYTSSMVERNIRNGHHPLSGARSEHDPTDLTSVVNEDAREFLEALQDDYDLAELEKASVSGKRSHEQSSADGPERGLGQACETRNEASDIQRSDATEARSNIE